MHLHTTKIEGNQQNIKLEFNGNFSPDLSLCVLPPLLLYGSYSSFTKSNPRQLKRIYAFYIGQPKLLGENQLL